MASFGVTASAGTLRSAVPGWTLPHAWTQEGVAVDGEGTGASVLHLSVALCVLNDTFRESQALGVPVAGVRVAAGGAFDAESWVSLGITYAVEIDSPASPDRLSQVLARVDEVAEIPRALRSGMSVERAHG